MGTADDQGVIRALGPAYPTVLAFAELLAQEGVTRGLLGPREMPRLWERHLLNSAAVASFLPHTGTVIDVGTGAGLPGVVLAAMRPDLPFVLLEPMERRVTWLREVVAALGLDNAEVVRARAEDLHGVRLGSAVTARAVAPMDRLAAWSLPLLAVGGVLLAMKGRQARAELDAAQTTIRRLGGGMADVIETTVLEGVEPTTVVRVVRVSAPPPAARARRRSRKM